MKIDILAREGSPVGVTVDSIYGRDGRIGVGGAELALLTLCEEWQRAGHQVTLYNNPNQQKVSLFDQKQVSDFDGQANRDVLIIFRSPIMKLDARTKGLKVWWSCDQQTTGDFRIFSKLVDKIVCISPNHASFFKQYYGIEDAFVIDIPVRLQDYEKNVEKVPGQILFSSVPDRGLAPMKLVWDIISEENKKASLVITSDYRLWGAAFPQNEQYRLMFSRSERVNFRGGVLRHSFTELQMQSDILAYPCIYDELFCISVAEAQVAGAYPVTSMFGSLPTTNMGELILGDPNSQKFVKRMAETILNMLDDPDLVEAQRQIKRKAISRFHPDRIVAEWDKHVFL